MTARTITADTPMTTTTTKVERVDPKSDNAGMMAGADMYRRMQAKQKGSSSNGLVIGGVAAVAIIAAGAYFATHQTHANAAGNSQTAANTAASASQQAQSSAQAAQQSAQQANDAAQAKAVAQTGSPPAAATDSKPVKTPVRAEPRHEQPVVRHVVSRQPAASANDAASAAINANAVTAPPAPVTATAPAPAAQAPVQTAPAPAPTTAAPPPTATPAPTEQPAPTTPTPQ